MPLVSWGELWVSHFTFWALCSAQLANLPVRTRTSPVWLDWIIFKDTRNQLWASLIKILGALKQPLGNSFTQHSPCELCSFSAVTPVPVFSWTEEDLTSSINSQAWFLFQTSACVWSFQWHNYGGLCHQERNLTKCCNFSWCQLENDPSLDLLGWMIRKLPQLSKFSMLKRNANFLKYFEFLDVTTEILPKCENQGFIIKEEKYILFPKATIFVWVCEGIKKHTKQSIHFIQK